MSARDHWPDMARSATFASAEVRCTGTDCGPVSITRGATRFKGPSQENDCPAVVRPTAPVVTPTPARNARRDQRPGAAAWPRAPAADGASGLPGPGLPPAPFTAACCPAARTARLSQLTTMAG